ncbi:MAG: DUF5615 family PIN-like protein [Actinobacteria bacterium]|nr:DUF5615 family PIN-like protein [Actinomycetota bacterium]
MRFLVDLNLSRLASRSASERPAMTPSTPLISTPSTTTDEQLIEIAREEERFVVSADSDFGTILARTHAQSPSIIFVRRTLPRRSGVLRLVRTQK